MVPEEAVVSEGLRHIVYPVKDNKIERRVIRIGQRQGGKVEVVEGLQARRDDRRARRPARPRRARRSTPRPVGTPTRAAAPARQRAERSQPRGRAAARHASTRSAAPGGPAADAASRGRYAEHALPTWPLASEAGGAPGQRSRRHAGLRPLHPPTGLRRRGQPPPDRRRPRLADATARARISGGGPAGRVRLDGLSRRLERGHREPRAPRSSRAPSPGIEGIRQITSQSQNDRSSVSIEFEVARDPEAATSDVRDAVSRIIGRLPDGADTPVVRKVDANAAADPVDRRHLDLPRRAGTLRLPASASTSTGSPPCRASPTSISAASGATPCASGSTGRRSRPAASPSRTSRTRSSARTSSCRAAASNPRSAS